MGSAKELVLMFASLNRHRTNPPWRTWHHHWCDGFHSSAQLCSRSHPQVIANMLRCTRSRFLENDSVEAVVHDLARKFRGDNGEPCACASSCVSANRSPRRYFMLPTLPDRILFVLRRLSPNHDTFGRLRSVFRTVIHRYDPELNGLVFQCLRGIEHRHGSEDIFGANSATADHPESNGITV
jgi:hypothetical protein